MGADTAEPVLIAGAGPVGLLTALLVARWGIPSVVLEAAQAPAGAGSRAICFQRDVLDIFDRAGCAGPMIAEGVTWTTGRTYYRDAELFSVTFGDPADGALPPWINISQASVERYLLDRVAAEPLIDLRFGQPVTEVRPDSGGVTVRTGDGTAAAGSTARGSTARGSTARGSTARGSTVRGSHLVGADGARSAVRRLLGIGFPGRSYDDQFLICDIRADLPFPSERRFFFDPAWNPGRQVLVHQCPGGVWRIDWQVAAGFDLSAEQASGGLDARVRQITGERPYEMVWATAYRFHERVAETFAAGRVFLAGDAAHLYAPFGARGLNSGAQDADNLAWKLAFARRGWAPPALLASYETERAAAARENLQVTSATMEFLVPQTAATRRRRAEVLDRSLTDQAARALIDSGTLAEPFWYTASPLTTPGPSRDGFPAGPGAARPPVPGVICPDGPCTAGGEVRRLRQLLGREFVLLTQEPVTAESALRAARDATAAPVAAYALAGLDRSGTLRAALAATGSSVHVIRPDGHLAAVLPGPEPGALQRALARATGTR